MCRIGLAIRAATPSLVKEKGHWFEVTVATPSPGLTLSFGGSKLKRRCIHSDNSLIP